MNKSKKRYVVDENGERTGVILDIADYQQLLKELEELDCIRVYDAAKASNESIPFAQAVAEIEQTR